MRNQLSIIKMKKKNVDDAITENHHYETTFAPLRFTLVKNSASVSESPILGGITARN